VSEPDDFIEAFDTMNRERPDAPFELKPLKIVTVSHSRSEPA
jgi:hypothetical protein